MTTPTDRRYWSPTWRKLRRVVLARDGYRCQIQAPGCDGDAPLHGGHVDHIISPRDGGPFFDAANLRAACPPCNQSRGRGTGRKTPYPTASRRW